MLDGRPQAEAPGSLETKRPGPRPDPSPARQQPIVAIYQRETHFNISLAEYDCRLVGSPFHGTSQNEPEPFANLMNGRASGMASGAIQTRRE